MSRWCLKPRTILLARTSSNLLDKWLKRTGQARIRSLSPGRGIFSRLHVIQIGPGAHPASYPIGTWGSPNGVKGPGSEADQSSLSSAEVKNGGAKPPLPHVFMA
jgi:hypothetical protein